MRVLIVAKTRMGGGTCIGAMEQGTGRAVRLLPPGRPCHGPDASFEVGEVWDVEARQRAVLEPPHVEDHDEYKLTRLGRCKDVCAAVLKYITPWNGEPTSLFDGVLRWRKSGTGFVVRQSLPRASVGFWLPPRPLAKTQLDGRDHYLMMGHGSHVKIPLVGMQDPPPLIPAKTLLRVSLARWWVNPQAPSEGETCSLQLSGWIGDVAKSAPFLAGLPRVEDLPF